MSIWDFFDKLDKFSANINYDKLGGGLWRNFFSILAFVIVFFVVFSILLDFIIGPLFLFFVVRPFRRVFGNTSKDYSYRSRSSRSSRRRR